MGAEDRTVEEVNTDSWLTAVEVSDVCICSLQTVQNWKRRDLLHPRQAMRTCTDGTRRLVDVYDPREIAAKVPRSRSTPASNPGELAARAFEMFEGGRELRDVVVELRVEPGRVSELHDQWMELGGSEIVLNPTAREQLGRLIGPFVGVADLVDRIADLVRGRASTGQVTMSSEAQG